MANPYSIVYRQGRLRCVKTEIRCFYNNSGGNREMYKVAVIEDEEHIVELLKFNLENNGYEVVSAMNGKAGLELVKNEKPHLVLLDLMIPLMDGIEVCKNLKLDDDTKEIPVIMLTAKSSETDKVLGLEIGADDYITKPFSIRELMARVKVALRRIQKPQAVEDRGIISLGELIINVDKHEVSRGETLFQLTLKEFELLRTLAENKGNVLSRNFLLDEIWGYDYYGETRTVDVHIRHLRKKVEDSDHKYIETIRGIGYKIK